MPLRIVNRRRVKVQVQFEPRDLWIGVFWRVLHRMPPPLYTVHFYVCLLPLVVLHITVVRKEHLWIQPPKPATPDQPGHEE